MCRFLWKATHQFSVLFLKRQTNFTLSAHMANNHQTKSPKSAKKSSRNRSRSSSMESSDSKSSSPVSNRSHDVTKVAILGAGGGIGQPLAMLLMLRCEYVQHVAMHDLTDSIHGIGLDISHIDRRCKITTHLGLDELTDAVRGAKVVVIPAGLAQKPGMSRDDLFGSNAKILYNLIKVCAKVVPTAMIAIITNPVNSLVPIACEVYNHCIGDGKNQDQKYVSVKSGAGSPSAATTEQQQAQQNPAHKMKFQDCFRRIFGVTTLDVVRASTLTAKSALFKSESNGMFKDPHKLQVPVVGGHAGKTIMPLLSQTTPGLNRKCLLEDKATTMTLVESIQQAGIDVLNAKKGKGSATIGMAYSACRFTISLLRAMSGEQNIVECAYVRQPTPVFGDLEYFATPLLLGKEGFVKSFGIPGYSASGGSSSSSKHDDQNTLLPYEQQMLEEGSRELRSSIARGEDFAREQLSADK